MSPESSEPYRKLVRHRDSSENAASSVTARCVARAPGVFDVAYRVFGDVARLSIAAPRAGERTDGLWRTTCFEFFARADGEPAYWEVNLSPSSDWAAYRFDDYRSGQVNEMNAEATGITSRRDQRGFEITARLKLPALAKIRGPSLMVGLSAILEDAAGLKSYWALAHPTGAPDFHDPACFTCPLNTERSL